jgi:WD40 repeat protein
VVPQLWDASKGTCAHTFSHHREAVTCCAWLPDSHRFVSGSVDKSICLLDTSGPSGGMLAWGNRGTSCSAAEC